MVIHIEFDIKITDRNGIVLQSSGKHCEANITSEGKEDTASLLGIDFTDFLAEYLSSSGFFLREKLMKGCGSGRLKGHVKNKAIMRGTKVNEPDDEYISDLLKGSELEYKIRIGNNKVLIGKIPLKVDADTNSELGDNKLSAALLLEEAAFEGGTDNVASSTSDVEIDLVDVPDSNEGVDCFEASDSEVEIDSLAASDNDEDVAPIEDSDSDEVISTESSAGDHELAVYKLLNYSMMKAIEKYEDNIYSVWYEATTDMEPAIDE